MRAAALRLGSQGLRTSFDNHLLIIGDAAGHIDPLTGEGIHTAMLVSFTADLLLLFLPFEIALQCIFASQSSPSILLSPKPEQ